MSLMSSPRTQRGPTTTVVPLLHQLSLALMYRVTGYNSKQEKTMNIYMIWQLLTLIQIIVLKQYATTQKTNGTNNTNILYIYTAFTCVISQMS